MKPLTVFALLIILALAACTSTPTPTPVVDPTNPVYPAPQATQPEAYPASQVESPAAGVIVFKLVPTESSLSYSVGETFINQGNKFATAMGVTTDIGGNITIDPANPQDSQVGVITADISKFKSDSDRRDNKIRNDFLESAKFPLVTFTPTALIGFPENPQPGESYNFQIVGDTTIRETTLPLTFDVTATVTEAAITGTASSTFLMSQFGFGPISLAGMLNTEDEVKITFAFVARP